MITTTCRIAWRSPCAGGRAAGAANVVFLFAVCAVSETFGVGTVTLASGTALEAASVGTEVEAAVEAGGAQAAIKRRRAPRPSHTQPEAPTQRRPRPPRHQVRCAQTC